MKITILTDNINSWYLPFGITLNERFKALGHQCSFINKKEEIEFGDICFLLSCTKILPVKFLDLNKFNIVIHASDLPQGKGFSPLQWQILEGKNSITLTLFNAVKELDAGDFFFKEEIFFEGHELIDELHSKMGEKINQMAEKFVNKIHDLKPQKQKGESSFYPKRTFNEDEIDPKKSILELFNHFRIANNNEYPLFFEYKGFKYNLKIEKRND